MQPITSSQTKSTESLVIGLSVDFVWELVITAIFLPNDQLWQKSFNDESIITTVNYPTARKIRTVLPDPNISATSTNISGTSFPSNPYPKPEQTNIEQTRKINKGTSNKRTHIKRTISLLPRFYIFQLATLLPHNSNEPQITCQAIDPPNKSCHIMPPLQHKDQISYNPPRLSLDKKN